MKARLLPLLLLAACSAPPAEPPPATPTPTDVSGIVIGDDALGVRITQADGIALSEGEIKQQQALYLELAQEFEAKTGRKLKGVELGREQAALLQTMLSREEDVSLKGLLQQILDTRQQIFELHDKIEETKEQLPTPDIVKRGDTHLGLATEYLINTHGLDREAAEGLANRSLLTNELATGMEVWHFYVDGVYGTTVTQGTAKVSPFFLNQRRYRRLKKERDDAVSLAKSLEAEIVVLEATRDQLQEDLVVTAARLDRVQKERDEVTYEKELLQADKAELVAANESVWYHIDTARRLREKDILAPGGMRLRDWRKDLFDQSLDLREGTSLTVFAEDFGVRRIRKLVLLPASRFKGGTDYQIEIDEDGRRASIHLDNIGKFKDDAFVVALR